MSHYGICVIPTEHKNAINVLYALLIGDNPAGAENLSQPASASGSNPATHWFGGRQYSTEELSVYQDMANNMPSVSWPVSGVSGEVTEAQAQAAAATLVITVTTRDAYTSQQAQETLVAALGALGIQKIVEEV